VYNACDNVRLCRDEIHLLSTYKNILKERIIYLLEMKGYHIQIINQGSYATFTQYYISDKTDFDVDIGVVFLNLYRFLEPNYLRKLVYDILQVDPETIKYFTRIESRTNCIAMYLKDEYNSKNIKFEICIYKRQTDYRRIFRPMRYFRRTKSKFRKRVITYFGYGNSWKEDDKEQQMRSIRGQLAKYKIMRRLIIFLKVIISGHPKLREIFKSIIITELVVQYYKKEHRSYNFGYHYYLIFENCIKSLNEKYSLNTSGNTGENLLNNQFRNIPKSDFIGYLQMIRDDLKNIYYSGTISQSKIFNDLTYELDNKKILCQRSIYTNYIRAVDSNDNDLAFYYSLEIDKYLYSSKFKSLSYLNGQFAKFQRQRLWRRARGRQRKR